MKRQWTVLGVPIDSVGVPRPRDAPFGTELAPSALRDLGLPASLGARDGGDLAVRITGPERDPVSGIIGWPSVGAVTATVRQTVRKAVAGGQRPLMLGGCCTLEIGAVAGARDALGRVGIISIDGHVDAYDHRSSPTGEAADMPMAALMGVGWSGLLAELEPGPVVAPGDAIVLGARDQTEANDLGDLPQRLGIAVSDVNTVRSDPEASGRAAVSHFAASGSRYWVHLDVDVLDEAIFPATDYLMPGGLDFDELGAVLAPIGEDPAMIGLSLGCYSPAKDPGQRCGEALVTLLADVLRA
jgi:arginase